MIEGHGDDSYKYSRPITANFSSNVYNRVDLSALKAHLCARIDGIGNYPEPEPYTLEACLARCHPSSCRGSVRDERSYRSHLSHRADFPRDKHRHCAAHFQ